MNSVEIEKLTGLHEVRNDFGTICDCNFGLSALGFGFLLILGKSYFTEILFRR